MPKRMSYRSSRAAALAMVFLVLVHMASAQIICNAPIAGLMSCRAAATPPNPPAPTSACCSTLSHADLQCLCLYKNSNVLPSVGIDPKLALQLPAKCNLAAPKAC